MENNPFGDAPVIEGTYQEADPNEPEKIVEFDQIQFIGTIISSDPEIAWILVQADPEFVEKYNLWCSPLHQTHA